MYPVTIVEDRYTGTYSGGKWTAWNRDFDAMPMEIVDSDVECREFWYKCTEIVGRGETPAEAYADLIRRTRWRTKMTEKNE